MNDQTEEAISVAKSFLDALEGRRLDEASGYLAPSAIMTFPGNHDFRDLPSLVRWAQGRYRSITKSFDRFEAVASAANTIVVYCFGTLEGVLPDGEPFSGVRFVDRFEIRDGLIQRQMVWNDLGNL